MGAFSSHSTELGEIDTIQYSIRLEADASIYSIYLVVSSTRCLLAPAPSKMHDPFPIPPLPWLSDAVQPLADALHWPTLPLHVHEVLFSFLLYSYVEIHGGPALSRWLLPTRYPQLAPDKQKNWDVHVVSLTQSLIVNSLALYVMFADKERAAMDWYQRMWGYTGAMGLVQGFATGYFLWDLVVTLRHYSLFGPGMLAHAISALMVFSLGFVSVLGCWAGEQRQGAC